MSDKNIDNLEEVTKGYFNIPIKENHEADEVWRVLALRQFPNIQNRASQMFFDGWERLGLKVEGIPSIESLHNAINKHTSWSVSETNVEYTATDDWFEHMADNDFIVTNFIRSRENINYTPYPEMFHDVFGHLPFMTINKYASLIHNFGKIYKNLREENKEAFRNFWWYTIEFGLIKEDGEIKAFGAGLLSSFGEFNNAFSKDVEIIPFDIEIVSKTPISDHDFHKKLFVLESFDQLESELEKWKEL